MDRNDSTPDHFRDNHNRFNKTAFNVRCPNPTSVLLKIRRLLPLERIWYSVLPVKSINFIMI